MNNEEKKKVNKILNKRVNGQIYLVNKYGMRLGWLVYNWLYTDITTRNTPKRIKALSNILNISNEEYRKIEKIIANELNLAN